METLALEVKHLTLAWIKTHVGTEGNEQADQAAKEGAVGGLHMKETQTPIPWQVPKSKIEDYTTAKWKQKWITAPHYCAVPIHGHIDAACTEHLWVRYISHATSLMRTHCT